MVLVHVWFLIISDDEDPADLENQALIDTKLDICSPKQKVRQVIRVTPVSGNPRSILLPVSIKNMKGIKTIKIVNADNLGQSKIQRKTSGLQVNSNLSEIVHSNSVLLKSSISADDVSSNSSSKGSLSEETGDESDSPYPRLQLTGITYLMQNLLYAL